MAYGLKYSGTFSSTAYNDLASKDYIVKLLFDGYGGSSSTILLNGFSEKDKSYGDSLIGIKEVKFTFGVVSDTLGIDDFYPDSERHVKVELYSVVGETETLVRSGFLIEENAKIEHLDGNKTIVISATDGLELLKGEQYVDASDKHYSNYPYADRVSILTIIRRCLDKIGTGLKYNTAFNTCAAADTPSAAFDVLAYRERGQSDYLNKNCYDILTEIATSLNCQLFQEDGEWWFVHLLGQSGGGQFYRKWDDGSYVSGGTIGNSLTTDIDAVAQPMNGVITLERSYKKIVSEIKLSGYQNDLTNADFDINTDGVINEWSGNTDTFVAGGSGTLDDPFYGEIGGFQSKGALDFTAIKRVEHTLITLGDVSNGDDLDIVLKKKVTIKGEVKGVNVKEARVGVLLKITPSSPTSAVVPFFTFSLSESGDWVHLGQFSFTEPNFNIIKNTIPVSLIDEDGVNYTNRSKFSITSGSIRDIIVKNRVFNVVVPGLALFNDLLNLQKITADEFAKVELSVVLFEGYQEIETPIGASRLVQFSSLKLEIEDVGISKRAESITYKTYTEEKSIRELKIDRTLIDFSDIKQSATITSSGAIPSLWVTNTDANVKELVEHLNKELLYCTHLPQKFYEGDIKGVFKRRELLSIVGLSASSIPVSWNYDFYDSIAGGVKYQQLWTSTVAYTSKKYATQESGRELEFINDEIPPFIDNTLKDFLPMPHPEELSGSGFWEGNLVIDKAVSGAINFIDSAGLVTDYLRPEGSQFFLKADSGAEELIATDANAWMLNGNTLGAKKTIGSLDAYDVGIIREGTEIVTIKSTGVDVTGKITATSAAITGLTTDYIPKVGTAGLLGNSLIYDNGTSVGIGTVSPNAAAKLHLVGNALINGKLFWRGAVTETIGSPDYGIGLSNVLEPVGGTQYFTRISDYYGLILAAGSSDVISIVRNGNVGIGTTSPAYKLDVNGTGYFSGILTANAFRTISSNTNYNILSRDSVSTAVYIQNANATGDILHLLNGSSTVNSGTSRFIVKGTGNVGIGTVSPAYKLDVNGNARFSSSILGKPSLEGALIPTVYNSHAGFSVTADPNYQKFVAYGYNYGSYPIFQVAAKTYAADQSAAWDETGTVRMTVTANGNVGIGTVSPAYKLDVNGTGRFVGSMTVFTTNGTTDGSIIVTNGTATNSGFIQFMKPGNVRLGYIGFSSGNMNYVAESSATHYFSGGKIVAAAGLQFTTGASSGYILQSDASGNASWTNPTAVQSYQGAWDASTNTPTLSDATGTQGQFYRIIVAASRDLGSGSISWTLGYDIRHNGSVWEELPVGSLAIASASVLGGIKLGSTLEIDGAGVLDQKSGIATAGTYKSVTVDTYGRVTAGTNPTTIAGYGITDYDSLWDTRLAATVVPIANGGTGSSTQNFVDLTTAQANIAGAKGFVSDITVNGITIGNRNSADNLLIGTSALSSSTGSASENTAIGYFSLKNTTDGAGNTALGAYSLYFNTTGAFNNASGGYSLESNTTGFFNNAVGWGALQSNATGNYNSASGAKAGTSITTGSNNTFLGYQSGGGITTGSGNTVLGYNITGLSATLADTLIIGAGGRQDITADATSIEYSRLLKPNGTGATTKQVYSNNGTIDLFVSLDGSYISDWSDKYDAADFNADWDTRLAATVVPIANGGTGASTKNFVDLTTAQIIAGAKTFSSDLLVNGIIVGSGGAGYSTNTVIGTASFRSNYAAGRTTILGGEVMDSHTYGSYNTAIGYSSLYSSDGGGYNTVVGESGGYNITTGSNNTFLGYQSGGGITTGSGNTILGYNITGLSATLANTLIIGAGGRQDLIADATGFQYNGLLRPDGTAGTAGQFLGTDGTNDAWVTLSNSDFIQTVTQTSGNFERVFEGLYLSKTDDKSFFIGTDTENGYGVLRFKTLNANGATVQSEMAFDADDNFRPKFYDPTADTPNYKKVAWLDEIVSSTPTLQSVTDEGATSTIRLKYSSGGTTVNYATMSDVQTGAGIDTVLANDNKATSKDILLKSANLGDTSIYFLNSAESVKGEITFTQSSLSSTNLEISAVDALYLSSSASSVHINSSAGAIINSGNDEPLYLNAYGTIGDGTDGEVRIGKTNGTNYVVLNGIKYNFYSGLTFADGDQLIMEYNSANNAFFMNKLTTPLAT